MVEWEYRVYELTGTRGVGGLSAKLGQALKQFGEQGWELVSVAVEGDLETAVILHYFKRPKAK